MLRVGYNTSNGQCCFFFFLAMANPEFNECVLGPRGNPPHGPLERGHAPHSRGALASQPRAP